MKSFSLFYSNQKAQIIISLLFLLSITSFLSAQELAENDPNAEYGLVYFLRGKGLADAPFVLFTEIDPILYSFKITYNTFIDDVRVCKLNQRRYSEHRVSPGEDAFKVQTVGKKGKKKVKSEIIEIEAGKTYYIMIIHMGNYPAMQEITRNTALALCKENKLKRDPNCGDSEYVF